MSIRNRVLMKRLRKPISRNQLSSAMLGTEYLSKDYRQMSGKNVFYGAVVQITQEHPNYSEIISRYALIVSVCKKYDYLTIKERLKEYINRLRRKYPNTHIDIRYLNMLFLIQYSESDNMRGWKKMLSYLWTNTEETADGFQYHELFINYAKLQSALARHIYICHRRQFEYWFNFDFFPHLLEYAYAVSQLKK